VQVAHEDDTHGIFRDHAHVGGVTHVAPRMAHQLLVVPGIYEKTQAVFGGDETTLEKTKPIFQHLGRLTLLVGSTGAGNTAKLAINTLLAFHAQGLAEAVVFARNKGIKTEDLLTLINNSAMGNVFAKIKGDAILQNNYKAAFALKHIAKDLRLAKQEGLETPMGATAFQTFQQAEPVLGEEDIISIIKYIASFNQVMDV
jgi:3-hydroxyisobutyrate dehydrogenase